METPCETLPEDTAVATDERTHTILIVDDDTDLADCLAYRLREQGFNIRTAANGKDGLSLARSSSPKLIVLDIGLPDRDGLSICEELADSPDTCQIPILILSGCDKDQVVRRARAAGCRYYLAKPCDPNTLLLLIHQSIEEAEDWNL